VCYVKSLLQDVSSHGRIVDETVSKAQALMGASHDTTKNRYENHLAMTKVNMFIETVSLNITRYSNKKLLIYFDVY